MNQLGKIINNFHLERLCNLMKDHQGNVIYGNARADEDKNLTPTVILSPALDSPIMQEEIFGPILPIVNF